ncbi:MAG: sulfotransferase [Phycisphaerae bacterium]|nr:sulfotransferase [Phycisphaerae bacterium]
MSEASQSIPPQPVVVGATGGSGTRAVRELLARAGVYMGSRVNPPGDALDFLPFHQAVINWTLQHTRSVDYRLADLPDWLRREGLALLRRCLGRYLDGAPQRPGLWGWKVPTTLYLLPYIAAVVPDFRLVHVVRDGRDIAFSRNQRQTFTYHGDLFGRWQEQPLHAPAIRLWSRVNVEAMTWARRELPGRYLLVRFEDLCGDPTSQGGRILSFVGSDADPAAATEHIRQVQSIGRWRRQPGKIVGRLCDEGRAGLEAFGYLDGDEEP